MAITFNGALKRIYITNTSSIIVKDVYSAWKNWLLLDDNLKFLQAFRTVGGDPTVSGQSAPVYYFLTNDWKIVIDGINVVFAYNLYTYDGSNPIVALNGATASLNNSDVGIVQSNAGEVVTFQTILNALTVINNGIKRSSKFMPHSTDF